MWFGQWFTLQQPWSSLGWFLQRRICWRFLLRKQTSISHYTCLSVFIYNPRLCLYSNDQMIKKIITNGGDDTDFELLEEEADWKVTFQGEARVYTCPEIIVCLKCSQIMSKCCHNPLKIISKLSNLKQLGLWSLSKGLWPQFGHLVSVSSLAEEFCTVAHQQRQEKRALQQGQIPRPRKTTGYGCYQLPITKSSLSLSELEVCCGVTCSCWVKYITRFFGAVEN